MSVRTLLCTTAPALVLGLALAGCHKDADGSTHMGMANKGDMSMPGMSKDDVMKKGEDMIMKGQMAKDNGMKMNDQKMMMDGQNMIDKGQMMKDKAMKM